MVMTTLFLLFLCLFAFSTLLLAESSSSSSSSVSVSKNRILVVGSANADTFLPLSRLPTEGENLTLLPGRQPIVDVPGGKGCTQAVAASKLIVTTNNEDDNFNDKSSSKLLLVSFVGQFGNDAAAAILQQALRDAKVDISQCGMHNDLPSGRGYVFWVAGSDSSDSHSDSSDGGAVSGTAGQVSAVVSGGSNIDGWSEWQEAWNLFPKTPNDDSDDDEAVLLASGLFARLDILLQDCGCILLQREIPEYVNRLVATWAKKKTRNGHQDILVLQDVGGEDRPMDKELLSCCDYVMPNESELRRLVKSFQTPKDSNSIQKNHDDDDDDDDDDNDEASILKMIKVLQENGARNVLVTRGSRGSILVTEGDAKIFRQSAAPATEVVDETGAGDCFRAAFAVALMESNNNDKMSLQECMEFASAAGACSVERSGAVPSTPTRQHVEAKLKVWRQQQQESGSSAETVLKIPRGDGLSDTPPRGGASNSKDDDDDDGFPFLIGSRLNSMKDRPELWDAPLVDAKDYVKRQGAIQGLTCVDFNYPQHFDKSCWSSTREAKEALEAQGLVAGAVCLRYPSKFARGAMNHPNAELRREAIDLTLHAAQVALDLGCNEVVVWSAYDGYDYPFSVDYDVKWQELVIAFQKCCDAFPNVKFSLEYKPTDENTRFFTVPSTGAAILLVHEVDRENFGLTLDVGHMLMSGENPGQSIAMVGRMMKGNKLFGIQLNDGYTRLAAEDGLMFGSIHPSMALEIMYQLRRIGFAGHLYFDTFPQRTDPVKEAEYNIRRVKAFWKAAGSIDAHGLRKVVEEHDALGALELTDEALRRM